MRIRMLGLMLMGLVPLMACREEAAEEMETAPLQEPGAQPPGFATLDTSGDSHLDADELAEWVDDEGIFTRWDIDADSELDAEEISQSVFTLWDMDEDAVVTEDEWALGVDRFYSVDLDPGTFQDWDMDGDSELDMDELAEGLDTSDWNEIWYTDADPIVGYDEFLDSFYTLWDLDNDGLIDAVEYEEGVTYWTG